MLRKSILSKYLFCLEDNPIAETDTAQEGIKPLKAVEEIRTLEILPDNQQDST